VNANFCLLVFNVVRYNNIRQRRNEEITTSKMCHSKIKLSDSLWNIILSNQMVLFCSC